MLQPTGFFRAKTDSLLKLSAALVERFDGQVPARLDDLVTLPGVGRKTANVVLGNAFGIPGITVDTHFGRLARRLGWTDEADPVAVEHAVGPAVPQAGLDAAQPPADLARPPGLPRPQAGVRGVHRWPGGARRSARARPTRTRRPSWSRPRAGREPTRLGPRLAAHRGLDPGARRWRSRLWCSRSEVATTRSRPPTAVRRSSAPAASTCRPRTCSSGGSARASPTARPCRPPARQPTTASRRWPCPASAARVTSTCRRSRVRWWSTSGRRPAARAATRCRCSSSCTASADGLTVLGVDYLDLQPQLALDFAGRAGVTYPSLADVDDRLRSRAAAAGAAHHGLRRRRRHRGGHRGQGVHLLRRAHGRRRAAPRGRGGDRGARLGAAPWPTASATPRRRGRSCAALPATAASRRATRPC